MLLVPKRQSFRIFGSKEKSTDSRYLFHFRPSMNSIANSGSLGMKSRRLQLSPKCKRHCADQKQKRNGMIPPDAFAE
jgi:hypothetical protein